MERKTIWSKRAASDFARQAEWYYWNRGADYERSFTADVHSAASRIASMPTIGLVEREANDHIIRSLLIHPKCRIIYRYDEHAVYIMRLRFTQMQS